MGMSNSVYIGPYLLVKNKVVDVKVIEKYSPNTNRTFKEDVIFCPDTGVKLEVRTKIIQEKRTFIWFDVPLKEDTFYSPPYPQLKGETVHIMNTRNYSYSNDDNFVLDLTDHEISEILRDFKKNYQDYLDYLTRNNWEFTIHYGVVHYAS